MVGGAITVRGRVASLLDVFVAPLTEQLRSMIVAILPATTSQRKSRRAFVIDASPINAASAWLLRT